MDLSKFDAYTPGPWKAFCRDTGYVEGEPWSEDRFLQWDIEGPEEPDGRGQFFEKDARLIAAAPDLLAEVRRLAALVERMREAAHAIMQPHFEHVKRANFAACGCEVCELFRPLLAELDAKPEEKSS